MSFLSVIEVPFTSLRGLRNLGQQDSPTTFFTPDSPLFQTKPQAPSQFPYVVSWTFANGVRSSLRFATAELATAAFENLKSIPTVVYAEWGLVDVPATSSFARARAGEPITTSGKTTVTRTLNWKGWLLVASGTGLLLYFLLRK